MLVLTYNISFRQKMALRVVRALTEGNWELYELERGF